MEELIISDADLNLLSQILKSPSPEPEGALEIQQQSPSSSQVSKAY